MSANALKTAATAGTAVATEKKGLPALLQQMKPQLALALPKHMNADRMVRIALTELRKNPKLMQADPQTVMASIVMASQLGLEPGLNGQAYLIPYEDKRKAANDPARVTCTFVPGWKGLVDLAQRSGRASVWTGAVFTGDDFEYELGSAPFLRQRQGDQHGNPAMLTHVWAQGRIRGAEFPIIEVWSMNRVIHHRDRFNKVGDRHYSHEHPEMYGRKVALLQVLKYMPQSIELATAIDLEHAAESGKQALDMNDAIAGTFSPVTEDGGQDGAGGEQPSTSAEVLSVDDLKALMRAAKSPETVDALWKQHKGNYTGDALLDVEAFRNIRVEQLREGGAK